MPTSIKQNIQNALLKTLKLTPKQKPIQLSDYLQSTLALQDSLCEIKTEFVTGCGNFSESVRIHDFIVPDGERWTKIFGEATPDVSATVLINHLRS